PPCKVLPTQGPYGVSRTSYTLRPPVEPRIGPPVHWADQGAVIARDYKVT
ncbi:hypothetical protein LINPERPRIM_LOCUS22195, partial [Linum perenne]